MFIWLKIFLNFNDNRKLSGNSNENQTILITSNSSNFSLLFHIGMRIERKQKRSVCVFIFVCVHEKNKPNEKNSGQIKHKNSTIWLEDTRFFKSRSCHNVHFVYILQVTITLTNCVAFSALISIGRKWVCTDWMCSFIFNFIDKLSVYTKDELWFVFWF